MNEERKEKQNFRNPESAQNFDWAQTLSAISSLEARAKACNAYAILTQLESMRKAMLRSNVNKKLMRATMAKLAVLQAELSDNKNTR